MLILMAPLKQWFLFRYTVQSPSPGFRDMHQVHLGDRLNTPQGDPGYKTEKKYIVQCYFFFNWTIFSLGHDLSNLELFVGFRNSLSVRGGASMGATKSGN